MKLIKSTLLFLCAATLLLVSVQSGAQTTPGCCGHTIEDHSVAEEISKEQSSRQISRHISSAISKRIFDSVAASEWKAGSSGMGASSDGGGILDAVWTDMGWTRISEDGLTSGFDTDLFQATVGTDKRFGDFIVGATVSYAYTDTDSFDRLIGTGNRTHTVDLSPYAAFIINKNLFISAFTGYSYYTTDPIQATSESERDGYITEAALNGMHNIDNWSFRGKAGVRYQHFHDKFVETNPRVTDNVDNWIGLANLEIGYNILPEFRVYSGALFEYNTTNSQPNPNTPTFTTRGDGVFYFNGGLDYSITEAFSLGVKVQTELSNRDVDLTTVGLSARLSL